MKILICDDDLMFAQAVHDRLLEFCSRNGISASVIVHRRRWFDVHTPPSLTN